MDENIQNNCPWLTEELRKELLETLERWRNSPKLQEPERFYCKTIQVANDQKAGMTDLEIAEFNRKEAATRKILLDKVQKAKKDGKKHPLF